MADGADQKREHPWGEHRTVRYPERELSALGVPPVATRVLSGVGLPNAVWSVFTSTPPERREVPRAGAGVRIGQAWNDEFAVCVVGTEEVFAVHIETAETTFVNTDLARFVEFLSRVAEVYDQDEMVDSGQIDSTQHLALVHRYQEEMRALDPAALADGAWWAGIVDELTMF